MRVPQPSLRACCAVVVLLACTRATAQPLPEHLLDPWRWTRFSTSSGLPSNRVSAIHEASDGSMWGVAAGVAVRFDGFHWVPVPNPAAPTSRVAQIIGGVGDDVAIVAGGQLWLGAPGRMTSALGPSPRVMRVARFAPARYLVHRSDNTLAIVEHGRAVALDAPPGIGRQRIFDIWGSPGGIVLLADRGLYVFAGTTWRLLLETDGAHTMILGADVESPDAGLVYVHYPLRLRGAWEWRDGSLLRRIDELPRPRMSSLSLGPGNSAIVAYETGEVWVRRDRRWSLLPLDRRADVFADTIFVRFARNGDLWVGRERGLFLLRRLSDRWTYYSSERGGLWNQINDLVVASSGTLWAATGTGVVEYRPTGESIEHTIDGARLTVTGIAEDARGAIWAVSGAGFVGAYRFNGQRWERYVSGTPLDDVYIHRIATDRSGHLWFLTLNASNEWQPSIEPDHAGAFRYDGQRFEQWNAARGLDGRVYAMVEDRHGAFWFGTSRGLKRWKDGAWRTWDTSDQFITNRVFALAVDDEGRVWFGDQQRGLGYITSDIARYFTTADGLVSEAVWGLAVGASGELWIATHGGLSRHSDDTWATFDAESGLHSTQLWPIVAKADAVYVGTTAAGIARLSLDEARSPTPLIEAASPVVSATSALVRWTAHAWWGAQPPEQVRTRSRLDGGAWSPWSTTREQTTTDLAPGPHTFDIQSANHFGRHDETHTVVSFRIPPPLYRQPTFFVPMAVLAAAVAALAMTLSIKQRRHRAEQAASAEALQHAQKMESIGRLAGGVAHDFNNLLTVILGNIDLLRYSLIPGGAGSTELASIRLAAEQAGRLTRQLLAFARRQPFELHTVPINDVVRGTLGLVSRLLGEAVVVDSRLDDAAGAVRVDRSRLEQVLVNLLVNARDAMPDGGRITISTSNEQVTETEARLHLDAAAGNYVVVSVADSGHGMDAETLAHLFEPFFTTKHEGKGTGLGLATSYGTVRQSGGHIRVESRPGEGSTFRIFLPRVFEPATEVASIITTPAEARRETILVAEDQAMLRALVSRVLQQQGYTVFEASDGAEALDIAIAQGPRIDLVVTDIVMPRLRGTELARRVRAMHPSVKVLFISGYPDDEPMENLEPGIGFLPKPFTPQILGERVRGMLEGSQ